ncbi:MAG: ParB/RepB/Spo0J family partition protein [Candidatus Portnoybacteria bacterium]|nr:ParB/RepB/Spo0J family partition protein [Candidatus Portnoybacteria bacterium]
MQNIGKGLHSLIPPKSASGEVSFPKISQPLRSKKESVFNVETNKIKPNPMQPRQEMDREDLQDLAESIKEHGILQPLIVTKSVKDLAKGQDVEYTLIAGHRRWEAAKMIGLPHVPVIIRDSTEQQKLELALVENLQRSDLNGLDKAKAFKRLSEEFDLTHQEIAQKVGKSRELVTNTIRLLNLPQEIKDGMMAGKISDGHARTLAGIKSPQAQKALYDEIIKNNMNVRQVEQRVREISVKAHRRKVFLDPEIKKIAGELTAFLGNKTEVRRAGIGGKIVIEFSDKGDLEKVIKKILKS